MKYYIRDNQKIYGPAEAEKIYLRISNDRFSKSAMFSKDQKVWMSVSEFLAERTESEQVGVASAVPVLQAKKKGFEMGADDEFDSEDNKTLHIVIGIVVMLLLLGGLGVAGYFIYENL